MKDHSIQKDPCGLVMIFIYAEMPKYQIMRWSKTGNKVFWTQQGCGPTSIALYGDDEFIILCHFTDKLVRVGRSGKELGEFHQDQDGSRFVNPNDSDADKQGGVFFTASGQFHKKAPHVGAIYYLSASGAISRVASGLWYANGIVVDRNGKRLLVSEHLGRRIIEYSIDGVGTLGDPIEYLRLDDLDLEGEHRSLFGIYENAGPDGLELDREGNLYICEYGAGRVLVVNPKKKLLKVIKWTEQFLTNITLGPLEKTLILTGSSDNIHLPFPGKVARIDNSIN